MSDFRLPAGSVSNREMSNTSGNEVTVDKLWHVYKATERFGLKIGDTPTTQEPILFQADHAGKLGDAISASMNVAGSSASVSFDVKKNGTTVLSAAMVYVHGLGNRGQIAGAFASAAAQSYAIGDVISCAVTATTTTGTQGPVLNYQRIEQGD